MSALVRPVGSWPTNAGRRARSATDGPEVASRRPARRSARPAGHLAPERLGRSLVDLVASGTGLAAQDDPVDALGGLARHPPLENVLEHERRIALQGIPITATAAGDGDDALTGVERDRGRLRKLGPLAVRVELPRVGDRTRLAAADTTRRVVVPFDRVRERHRALLGAEHDS